MADIVWQESLQMKQTLVSWQIDALWFSWWELEWQKLDWAEYQTHLILTVALCKLAMSVWEPGRPDSTEKQQGEVATINDAWRRLIGCSRFSWVFRGQKLAIGQDNWHRADIIIQEVTGIEKYGEKLRPRLYMVQEECVVFFLSPQLVPVGVNSYGKVWPKAPGLWTALGFNDLTSPV